MQKIETINKFLNNVKEVKNKKYCLKVDLNQSIINELILFFKERSIDLSKTKTNYIIRKLPKLSKFVLNRKKDII